MTRYPDVVEVLHHFSANRTPTPEQLSAMGLSALNPIAQVMVRQMLFLDPPDHTRLRALASAAFTPARVELLRAHIQEIVDSLLDAVTSKGRMDVIADFESRSRHIDCGNAWCSGGGSRAIKGLVSRLRRDAGQLLAQS